LGVSAGQVDQGTASVAVGFKAGKTSQGNTSVAIGQEAGTNAQGSESVAMGYWAGCSSQTTNCVAIGREAGRFNQGSSAVAIGIYAGCEYQASSSVAIGDTCQRVRPTNASYRGVAVAVGYAAGQNQQAIYCTAMGVSCGQNNQQYYATAFGVNAGTNNQGHASLALGPGSGHNSQNMKSVALGINSGQTGLSTNSIVISAGNNNRNGDIGANRLTIAPIRADNSGYNLKYNGSTLEVSHTTSDDRLKDDEKYIRNALTTIMKLKPQTYEKRDELDPQSATQCVESGHMAQDIYYDTPELRHLVHVPDSADPTPEKPPAPSDDPRDDPDYSAWGSKTADFDQTGLIPWLVRGVQEITKELPRSKTTVSNTWGQNISSLVVSANTNKYKTNTVPLVTLSNVHNDKSWYGVVSNEVVDADDYDTLVDTKGDTRIWVLDTNGSLESGDLLTTSNTSPGYATKQDDDFLRSYTVAKITQDCDFTEPTQRPIMRRRQQLTDVTYYIKKKVVLLSYSDYLVSAASKRCTSTKIVYRRSGPTATISIFRDIVQNIEVDDGAYDELPESQRSVEMVDEIPEERYNEMSDEEKVPYTRVEKTVYHSILTFVSKIKKTSHPIEEIIQELTDVLDENGQIIWEETGETEPIYTLVNHGTHKAALVTCKLI
jgi:hypothetical protein